MDFSQLLTDLLPSSGGLLVVRAIAAALLIFLIPGFAWTLVFFQKIHVLERTVLSVGLSIALVSFGVIVLNVAFDVRINGLNTILIVIVITVIPLAIYLVRRLRARHAVDTDED